MSKNSKQTVTQNQQLDSGTQAFRDQFLRPLAKQGAQVALGGDPLFTGPTQTFQDAISGLQGLGTQLGGLIGGIDTQPRNIGFGFSAREFDPSQISQFFNPFTDRVVEGVQSDFDRQRALAGNRAGALAAQAGAFGGSGGEIFESEARRNIGELEGRQLADTRFAGFQNAQQAAMNSFFQQQQLALQAAAGQQRGDIAGQQLGLQGLGQAFGGLGQLGGVFGQLAGLGDLERQIADRQAQEDIFRQQTALGFANQGIGPITVDSTQTTQSQTPFLQQLAGIALPVAGGIFGGPAGAAAGSALSGGFGGGPGLSQSPLLQNRPLFQAP